jgi:2,4-dienoyl-CoA reductase-like NADH-dependent reductase (Old Yellow Enzyme family)
MAGTEEPLAVPGAGSATQSMKGIQMSKLFSPIKIGAIDLSHRVVLAPLTRMRADLPGNVPNDLMTKYYEQRASEGGLLVTEATFVAQTGNGGDWPTCISSNRESRATCRTTACRRWPPACSVRYSADQ